MKTLLHLIKKSGPARYWVLLMLLASGLSAFGQSPTFTLWPYSQAINSGSSATISAKSSALSFNGSSDYVLASYNSNLILSSTGTIEAWVMPNWTAGSQSYNPAVLAQRLGNASDYSIHIRNGLNAIDLYTSPSGVVSWSYTMTKGTWYHLAFVYSGGTVTCYVNGTSLGSVSASMGTSTGYPLSIGATDYSTYFQEFWTGSIDEVRIWNTALSATTINANKYKTVPVNSSNLVAYYRFDEESGTTATDFSSTGNNGTVHSGSQYTTSTPMGNSANYTYAWSPSTGLNTTSGASVTASPTSSISYTATATLSSSTYSDASTVLVNAGALNFDGVNDAVYISNPFYAFNKEITVDWWVNPSSFMTLGSGIGQSTNNVDNMTTSNVWLMHFNGSGTSMTFYVNDAGTWRSAGPINPSAGNWHHIVGVANANGIYLYMDGSLMVSSSSGISSGIFNNSNSAIAFGRDIRYTSGRFCSCSIDEVRIYNRALCASEISNSSACQLGTNPSGLQEYYQLNSGYVNYNNSTNTTASDGSGNGRNGTLSNFALTGISSNWVAGTVSGTCATFSPPIMAVTGNGNAIANGSTTTSASNTTDYGTVSASGSTSQTYTINNSGNSSLTISSISFSGANASEFSVTNSPASIAANSSGTITISLTPTSTGTKSATISISNNDCYNNPYTFKLSGTALTPATGLNFDGSNDYIDVSSNTNIPVGNSNYTIEAWIKPSGTANYGIAGWGTWGSHNNVNAFRTNGSTQLDNYWWGNDLIVNVPNLADGNWHHVAATFDGTTRKIYCDGVLKGSDQPTGHNVSYSSNMTVGLTYPGLSEYMNGSMDEVKIWSRALCQGEIQNNMNCEMSTSQTGLALYYKLNQGYVNGTNTSLNTATDASGNGNTGTLKNFALTGSTSNWATGAVSGSCSSFSNGSAAISGNSNSISNGSTTASSSNGTDFGSVGQGVGVSTTYTISNSGNASLTIGTISFSGTNASDFTVTSAPASTVAANGSTNFTVTFTPSTTSSESATISIATNDCYNNPYTFALSGAGLAPAGALDLNGSTDYVDIGSVIPAGNSYTKECWVYANSTTCDNMISSNTDPFWITSGHLSAGNGSSYSVVTDPGAFSANTWTHVAVTYDAATHTMKLYKNGSLVATNTSSPSYSGGAIALGHHYNGGCYFQGQLDEVRIWSRALCQAEIQNNENCELSGSQTGLLAYYKLNQGYVNGNNSSYNTVTDNSGNGNTGTMYNFALSGSTSNWTTGHVSGSCSSYTAAAISLSGNGNAITVGSSSPSATNSTDFGQTTGSSVTETYTITNSGSASLSVSSIALSGTDASSFSVSGISLPATVGTSSSNTFTVTFNPSTLGVKNATVTVNNSDCRYPAYSFAIQGELTCTTPSFTTCPSNITVSTSASSCDAVATWTSAVSGMPTPSVTYSFSGATTGSGSGTGSGSTFNKGTTTVTLTATNTCGSATCSFTVTVNDNTAPVAKASDVTVYLDNNGTASLTATAVDNGSSDNCGIASLSLSQTSFGCGSNAVNMYNTNGYIKVPGVSHSQNFTYEAWVNFKNSPAWGGILTLHSNVSYWLQFTTDGNGHLRYEDAYLDRLDGNKFVGDGKWHHVALTYDGSTAKLYVDGSLDNSMSVSRTFNTGTHDLFIGAERVPNVYYNGAIQEVRIWGAARTQSQIQSTMDIRLSGSETNLLQYLPLNEGSGNSTVKNLVSGTSSGSFTNGLSSSAWTTGSPYMGGSGYITLTAKDNSGNSGTATAYVTVKDTIKPHVIVKSATVTLDASGHGSITVDNIDNGSYDNCTINTRSLSKTSFSCTDAGSNTVYLVVTDISGNKDSAAATVTVKDNTAPTASAQNVTIYLDANGKASTTASAVNNGSSDNCTVASLSLSKTDFTCSDLGDNTVTLTVTDESGNTATATATVTVKDNTVPTASAQNVTIYLDANGKASTTASAVNNGSSDNCTVSSLSLSKTDFTCSDLGDNTVTLTVTDESGNSSTATATVTVKDNTAPTASAQNVTIYLDANGKASTTASAVNNGSSDNCTVASLSLSKTNFTCSDLGDNTVTLTVTDESGNTSTATATVTVKDNTAPTASAQNVTIYLDANGKASTTASAMNNGSSDNCTVASLSLSKTDFTCSDLGDNTVTLTVTDESGNTSTASATVTVKDNTAPTASAQNVTLYLDANGKVSTTASAVNNGSSDNCTVASLSLSKTDFTCSDLGDNTVTLTVTDESGNSSTATATVTVKDNISPVAIAKNITINLSAGHASINPSDVDNGSYDNCSFTLSLDKSSFTCQDAGSVTVTLTATDASGNSSAATATVTVNAIPSADITAGGPTTFCNGNNVVLTANSGASYSWSNAHGPILGGSNQNLTVTASGTYYVTVTNVYGCSATSAGTTVTVNPIPVASASASPSTVYYGYTTAYNTSTLSGSSDISGSTYSWSSSPSGFSSTSASTTTAPTATTTYYLTVTSPEGCVSPKASVKVNVIDVHCGNNNNKVTICHNCNTICIDASAVASHLANHSGDHLGACGICQSVPEEELEDRLNIFPNPFTSTTNIELVFARDQQVSVSVWSVDGKRVKTIFEGNVTARSQYNYSLDGTTMMPGIYFVKVQSGDHMEVRKIELMR
jgi:hypothetical protein